MSQTALLGKDALLQTWDGTSWLDFVCATNVEFTCDTEQIERKGPGLAGFKAYVSGETTWGFSLNDVAIAAPVGGTVGVFYVLLESVRKNGILARLVFADSLGNLQVITGHVKIPHTGITAPIDGFVESTIEFQGDGPFSLDTALVNPTTTSSTVFPPIDYYATGGETSITYSDLISRTILGVWVGQLEKGVIIVGTPADHQVKYDSSTGTIYYSRALNPTEHVHILYQ